MTMSRFRYRPMIGCALVMASACVEQRPAEEEIPTPETGCEEAREVVGQFGARMRLVSVLAPDTMVDRALEDAYAPLVSAQLLDTWQAAPSDAPGRETSNPWPARIEIRTMTADDDECVAVGDVVHVTTGDTLTAVERRTVTLRLRNDAGWRITAYEESASGAEANPDTTSANTANAPADALRRHYAAVRDTIVTITDTARIEGAAGSQYATIPVIVEAVRNGERQRFTGTYTLRRSMVDGATAEQRAWRIYSADLQPD